MYPSVTLLQLQKSIGPGGFWCSVRWLLPVRGDSRCCLCNLRRQQTHFEVWAPSAVTNLSLQKTQLQISTDNDIYWYLRQSGLGIFRQSQITTASIKLPLLLIATKYVCLPRSGVGCLRQSPLGISASTTTDFQQRILVFLFQFSAIWGRDLLAVSIYYYCKHRLQLLLTAIEYVFFPRSGVGCLWHSPSGITASPGYRFLLTIT